MNFEDLKLDKKKEVIKLIKICKKNFGDIKEYFKTHLEINNLDLKNCEKFFYDSKLKEFTEMCDKAKKNFSSINNDKKSEKYKKEINSFRSLADFYEWYRLQPRKCYYCDTEEFKLEILFNKESGIFKNKRNRGITLELERLEPNDPYSKNNCKLACYVCNNHKSDFISKEDFFKYFSKSIRKYLNDNWKKVSDEQI